MAQDRKIFVGGVPQDLNQDDLYAIFSEYSVVRKAWLQTCRSTDTGSYPTQNHRGFGFVIFHDAHAINELLGSSSSRFVVLRNGAKLEVKRALSSNKMGGPEFNRDVPTSNRECRDLVENLQKTASEEWKHGLGKEASNVLRLLESVKRGSGKTAAEAWSGDEVVGSVGAGNKHAGSLDPMEFSARRLLSVQLGDPLTGRNARVHADHHAKQSQGGRRRQILRDAVVRFYQDHWPEKLDQHNFIDFICLVYEGREVELDGALRQKYGSGLPGKWNGVPNALVHSRGPSHLPAQEINKSMTQREVTSAGERGLASG